MAQVVFATMPDRTGRGVCPIAATSTMEEMLRLIRRWGYHRHEVRFAVRDREELDREHPGLVNVIINTAFSPQANERYERTKGRIWDLSLKGQYDWSLLKPVVNSAGLVDDIVVEGTPDLEDSMVWDSQWHCYRWKPEFDAAE